MCKLVGWPRVFVVRRGRAPMELVYLCATPEYCCWNVTQISPFKTTLGSTAVVVSVKPLKILKS